jgi:hypothetical protein
VHMRVQYRTRFHHRVEGFSMNRNHGEWAFVLGLWIALLYGVLYAFDRITTF